MTKKKTKETEEPRFELKKRQIKEKPNFFQNIPSFQHPLAEILNFPSENNGNSVENNPSGSIKQETSGHPENIKQDTQTTNNHDTQYINNLDTQTISNTDTQNKINMDTSQELNLDTQHTKIKTLKTKNFGQPEFDSNGAEAPKNITNAPRKIKDTSAPTPKSKKVVHSKNEDWRKYEKTRSTVRVNLHIDKEIDKKVRKYCFIDADPKVELREFYERAAVHLLDLLDTQKVGSLSAETPLDDRRLKMMYKTKPFIINLYLRYNTIFNEMASSSGKKWTARWTSRDDESATRYNELPATIIELGILQTQIQKGFGSSRIQTFKYYIDEIENVLSSGISDEMLDTIVQYHRQIWYKQTGREIEFDFLKDN